MGHWARNCFSHSNWRSPVKPNAKAKLSCTRCGRTGHCVQDCFACSTKDGQLLEVSRTYRESVSENLSCTRCGRTGHCIQDCFARSTKNGQLLEVSKTCSGPESEIRKGEVSGKRKRTIPDGDKRSGVYVLQYQDGNLYVGKSNDIDARIRQHTARNVKCTSEWQGSPIEVQPITSRLDDHESWERNETLERMSQQGVEKVRGWMYTTQHLSPETVESIDAQLCEKFDLCRSCGTKGHFVSECPLNKDKKPNSKSPYKTSTDEGHEDDSSYFSESYEDGDSSCFSDSSNDEDEDHTPSCKRFHGERDDEDECYDDFSD